MRRLLRAALALLFCALFVSGALLLAPLMVLFARDRLRAHGLVRGLWRSFVWGASAVRLIRVERGNLADVSGAVIVANHPSLIDVVILVALMPKTLYVAKRQLLQSFPLSFAVRATALPDDAQLLEVAPAYLAAGWNVLIFPEGTRSPEPASPRPFHRGAAQLALRTHAPILCVTMNLSRRLLAKGQPVWDMGTERVVYSLTAHPPRVPERRPSESLHEAAVRVTREMEDVIKRPYHSDTDFAGGVGQTSRRPPFAAVVPVFNPEPPLVSLCERLVESFPLVVVVDDGSVEHQEEFAALPPAVVLLRHEANRGKGAAMKTALRFLLEKGRSDIQGVVFVDGDGQHAVDDILAVASLAERSDKVVFGVRDFSRRRVPFRSWWGNRWTSWEVRLLFRFRVRDTQTGLRTVPRRLFEALVRLRGERFEFEAAWFPLLRTLKEEILTVPISTIYLNSNRASHFRPLRDTLLTQCALFGR